jgi:hypothetical protein
MTDPQLPPEEILDHYLDGKSDETGLRPDDQALADSLLAAANAAQPDPTFAAALESKLTQARPAARSGAGLFSSLWSPSMKRLSAVAIGTAVILILAVTGYWLTLATRQPALPLIVTAPIETQVETQTEIPVSNLEVPVTATPLPIADATLRLAPGLTLPDQPAEVALYHQQSLPAITVETAKEIAARLGIYGNVYQAPGEGGPSDTIYVVTDGIGLIRFIGTTGYYYYTADQTTELVISGPPLPLEERASVAEQFLQSIGFIADDHRLEQAALDPFAVQLVQLLEGRPILYENIPPDNYVSISSEGQIKSSVILASPMERLSQYPIISAVEAWQKANDPSARGVSTSFAYASAYDSSYRLWQPVYNPDGRVDLYGYPSVLPAVEPGLPPLITINNLMITGPITDLAQAVTPGAFMHVRGNYAVGEPFVLTGWEVSPLPFEIWQGTFDRAGTDSGFLLVGTERYALAHVPAEVPNGLAVEVQGVKVSDSEIVWSIIHTPTSGGGGGGGGGSAFPEVSLTAIPTGSVSPTATPSLPYQVGDTLTGFTGQLNVTDLQNQDGSTSRVYNLWGTMDGDPNTSLTLKLEGAIDGLEQLNNLSIKVWGKVTSIDQQQILTVQVERYEELYPGLRIQAWLGAEELVTIEERQVWLLTTPTGEQFVLGSSLQIPSEYITGIQVGSPGDVLIVEGYLKPDDSFGGYPVITDLTASMGNGLIDLSNYTITSAQPIQSQSANKSQFPYLGSAPTVEKVELSYLANDFTHGWPPPPEDCACRIVQPVWHFIGHNADGQEFSIIVQALTGEYLKP